MIYYVSKVFRLAPFFLFFLLWFMLLPMFVHAQSISLTAGKSSYAEGDNILVTVRVDTGGKPINTIGGKVVFDPAEISITEIRYGSSIISLWVEKPKSDSNGNIPFTGGIPGGFTGNEGSIFNFMGKIKKAGVLSMSLADVHVLLNDGTGKELAVTAVPLNLTVSSASASIKTPASPASETTLPPTSAFQKDVIPPENFVPLVSRHPSIADDAYFVSFFAVDKDSGIASYQVREKPFLFSMILSNDWEEAKSPYVLKYQHWASRVEVKAIDQAGNNVVAVSAKPFDSLWMAVFGAVLVFLAVYITRKFTRRPARVSFKRSL